MRSIWNTKIDTLRIALTNNPSLQLTILVDYFRTIRNHIVHQQTLDPISKSPSFDPLSSPPFSSFPVTKPSTDEATSLSRASQESLTKSNYEFPEYQTPLELHPLSSYEMLSPLVAEFPGRVSLHLFHSPQISSFCRNWLPTKINELIGVQHIKCYLIDDDSLISGANLSQQYFNNRQDRYVWIKNSPNVSNFYYQLIQTITSFSFYHNQHGELLFPHGVPNISTEPLSFCQHAKRKLEEVFYTESLQASNNRLRESDEAKIEKMMENDTWIFPTIQFGPIGVRYDEEITYLLLDSSTSYFKGIEPYLSSPYFNLTSSYQKHLKANNQGMRILVASPDANGFNHSGKLMSLIPLAYNHLLEQFFASLDDGNKIQISEYQKEGWTFHAKGLWMFYQPPSVNLDLKSKQQVNFLNDSEEISRTDSHALTLIGSSNFGIRSVNRDLESQILLFTTNQELMKKIQEERENLWKLGSLVTNTTFYERPNPWWLSMLTRFASSYM